MNANSKLEDRVARLIAWYGDGSDGASPTAEQWRKVAGRPSGSPVTLINFFKLRDQGLYQDEAIAPAAPESGRAAFDRYAAVSIPTMEKIGGRFLLVAPFEAGFVGPEEDWDLVAIGTFADKEVLLSLWEDADYHAAYPHRTAACARQKVVICNG
ncbi:DUF1330 domain-containing protein [Denitrobaculum tricleocarpae]|uniref:DUF1330 domain-containing protein n=1 Tax=Denitrobaculum tricleocarpae TaxID=2591009 RepID=UPI0015D3129C|nr:DUF1330 domain-containing protein [Denitrobaculum tricleocarpae]